MADWYRHKSWSAEEEEYFFTKLGRARKDGRAQYLKIQAIELVQTKDEKLIKVAESLINKLFSEYPDDKFNRPGALFALGNIYQLRSNYEKAIEYYKEAIDFEIIYPQVQTQAYINYTELIIKTQKTHLYHTVEKIITEKISKHQFIFPVEKYKAFSMLSIINSHNKNIEQAMYFEDLAEQNANQETSGLRYHKYLGVVKKRDSWLDKIMKRK